MMKKTIFLMLMTLFMFSCKSNLEQGKLVSKQEYEQLSKDKENNGKRFSVEGYPFINGDITVNRGFGKQLPLITFYAEPEGQGGIVGFFPIANGSGKNEFDAPSSFTMEDVTFYDNEGNPLKYTDKMRISFTMDLQVERERTGSGNYYGGPVDVRIDKAD